MGGEREREKERMKDTEKGEKEEKEELVNGFVKYLLVTVIMILVRENSMKSKVWTKEKLNTSLLKAIVLSLERHPFV